MPPMNRVDCLIKRPIRTPLLTEANFQTSHSDFFTAQTRYAISAIPETDVWGAFSTAHWLTSPQSN
jgi:hypothetical protein